MSLRAVSVCLGAVLFSGCNCGGGGGGVDAGPTPLNCGGVLACAAACPSSTGSVCEDGCVGRATQAAAAQLNAIVACNTAQACNNDDACLGTKCGGELAACEGLTAGPLDGGGGGGGGGDGFPNRYVGTVSTTVNLGGFIFESTGNATFVRDDQADPRGRSGMFAFYRLATVTYVAKALGSAGACTQSGNETVTVNAPPAFENLVSIEKAAGPDGQRVYDITTTLSTTRPGAITLTCTPGGSSTTDFNAELNVAAGVPPPKTGNLTRLQATAAGMTGWSWDLSAAP